MPPVWMRKPKNDTPGRELSVQGVAVAVLEAFCVCVPVLYFFEPLLLRTGRAMSWVLPLSHKYPMTETEDEISAMRR